MERIIGTAARQLELIDPTDDAIVPHQPGPTARPSLRLLKRDVYAELTRRRRRAQIAARHWLEQESE
jgi:hypothetical protein